MGYTDVEVFAGKDFFGNEVYGGFRFVVNMLQGSEILSAQLELYLEQMYPADEVAILDHFTDSNGVDLEGHTMDLGPATGWVAASGAITTESNVAKQDLTGTQLYVCETDAADGTVQCKTNLGLGGGNETGIIFRYVDTQNYWRLRLQHDGFSPFPLRVEKIVANVLTTVDTDMGYAQSTWYTFKAVLDGDSIKCYVDNVLMFDVTDSDLESATQHGLYGYLLTPYSVNKWTLWNDFDFVPAGTSSPNLIAACDDVDDSDGFDVDLPNTRTLTTARVSLGTSQAGRQAGTRRVTSVTSFKK